MGERFQFICLERRPEKRRIMAAMLAPLGEIKWLTAIPVHLSGYEHSRQRASVALEAAVRVPATRVGRKLKLALLVGQYNASRRWFERTPNSVAVTWNGLNGMRRVFLEAARDAGRKRLVFELAPLPGRITVDPCGVNFGNSLPRTPEPYRAWAERNAVTLGDWRGVARQIVQRKPKDPVTASVVTLPISDPFVFVPLQYPGDSQLRINGGAFRTVESFVATLISASRKLPHGWHLRLKEHPSAQHFVKALLSTSGNAPICLDNGTDTFAQVAASRAVLTVNSSVGLEAMYFDKPVIAAGDCFWAIPGVAHHASTPEAVESICHCIQQVDFDPHLRSAFLNFLGEEYYPKIYENGALAVEDRAHCQVAVRLKGPDEFGFWNCEHTLT